MNLKAEGGPEEYEVNTGVEAVGDKPVTLRIELEGGERLESSPEQIPEKPGEATWKVTKANKGDPLKLKMTRLDSRAASKISESLSLEAEGGPVKYKVTATLKNMPSVRNADEEPVKLVIEIEGEGGVEGKTEIDLTKGGWFS